MMRNLIFLFLLVPSLGFSIYQYPFVVPSYKLKEINTENFRIVYSESSKEKAFEVASIAEEQLAKLEKIYGAFQNITKPIRIIVSSDYQEANGFASVFIYPVIHIYVSDPPNISDSHSFTDSEYLKTLLYHELTHIVTLSVRQKYKFFLWQIISDAVYPAVTFSARSSIEGTAVARESDGGSGRLHDPYLYHSMRRNVLDQNYPSFSQISGASTLFGTFSYPYTFGALFNQYIRKNYGSQIDEEFWILSSKWNLSAASFKKLTGKSLKDLHKEFFASLSNSVEPYIINTNKFLLSNKKRRINSVQKINDYLYYFDYQQKEFRKINLKTGKNYLVAYGNQKWQEVSISKDEKLLLVSGSANLSKIAVVLDRITLLPKTQIYKGIKQAKFLPNANKTNIVFTGIDVNNTYPELVLYNKQDKIVLHQGNQCEYADNPVSIDNKNIYFLHKYKKETYLSRINISNKAIETVSNNKLKFPRFLTVSDQAIMVSYAENTNSFYKKAIIQNDQIYFIEQNIKGELFDSIIYDQKLIYRTSFSTQDNFGVIDNITKTSTQPTQLQTSVFPKISQKIFPIPQNIMAYQPYIDLSLFAWSPSIYSDKAGLRFMSFDSSGENILNFSINAEYERGTPEFDFSWMNKGHNLLGAIFVKNLYVPNSYVHQLGQHLLVSVGASFGFSDESKQLMGKYSFYTSLSLQYRLIGNIAEHPFTWSRIAYQQLISTSGFVWQNYTSEGKYGFYRLIEFEIQHKIDYLKPAWYQAVAKIALSPPIIPLKINIYGAYDSTSISTAGSSLLGFGLMPMFYEYRKANIFSDLAFLWTADLQFYSWEVQDGLGFGEFYITRWSFNTGYRGGYWDLDLHSIYVRSNLSFGFLYGYLPVDFFIEMNYAITTDKLGYNMGISIQTPI